MFGLINTITTPNGIFNAMLGEHRRAGVHERARVRLGKHAAPLAVNEFSEPNGGADASAPTVSSLDRTISDDEFEEIEEESGKSPVLTDAQTEAYLICKGLIPSADALDYG